MTLNSIVSEAAAALNFNRQRSLLTMASLAWGVACFVILYSYGDGFHVALSTAFRAVGQDLVLMYGGQIYGFEGIVLAGVSGLGGFLGAYGLAAVVNSFKLPDLFPGLPVNAATAFWAFSASDCLVRATPSASVARSACQVVAAMPIKSTAVTALTRSTY